MAQNRPLIEGTSRVEAFSDGVIAIIVTLLIFEVRLPEGGERGAAQIATRSGGKSLPALELRPGP
jgi:uncharacterized membrane protein